MEAQEVKLARLEERLLARDAEIRQQKETIDVLKSEILQSRRLIQGLTGSQEWKPGDPKDKKRKSDLSFPPIIDEESGEYRPMNTAEKVDHVGSLNEILGLNISAEVAEIP